MTACFGRLTDIDEALKTVTDSNKQFEAKVGKGKAAVKAESGDKLVIDFKGFIGDDQFAGGTAEDAELVIGSGQFIPVFEDQLIGAGALP